MKALQEKVNVVPLISKADCLTPGEIKKLKERVGQGSPMGGNAGVARAPTKHFIGHPKCHPQLNLLYCGVRINEETRDGDASSLVYSPLQYE